MITSKADIQIRAEQLIGLMDQRINFQVNRIIHHASFQALEGAWRGLFMVVNAAQGNKRVRVQVLQITLAELNKDATQAIELDQSQLFRKIYSEALDMPGGEPFGLLIGDYYMTYQRTANVRDGMECLQHIAKIASQAFVPFVTSVSPHFFGLDSFAELQAPLNIEEILKAPDYHRWHRLRQDENAHFIALTIPRVLMRLPYNANGIRLKQRFFKETVTRHEDYLWGNACYAYATMVIQCFVETGWFTNIRGGQTNITNENKALPRVYFNADPLKSLSIFSTECLMTDASEKLLSDAGFIAARDHAYAEKLLFYSSQTVKLPKRLQDQANSTSVKINTMLHYVLCMCRFAHYIKVIIRDKVGAFANAEACETFIFKWLNQYCSATQGQSLESIAKKPLTKAEVTISEMQGSPGKFFCSMQISPHSQFDDIQSHLKLITQVRLS